MLVNIVDGRPAGYLTPKEFAEKNGIAETTIRNQLRDGRLNAIYVQPERRKFWWIPKDTAPYEKSPKRKKANARKEPYPLNLVHTVYEGFYEGFEWEQTPDQIAGLEYVLTTLTEQEKKCVGLYFRNGMTYQKIGDVYHLSRERIRQIIKKTERKLRNPTRFNFIRYGYEGNIERLTPKYELTEEDRRADLLNTTIEEMNFSVRAFNCLKRGNINTVSDITERLKKDGIMKIRNIGPKSYEEIIQKVAPYYGMTVTEYIDFITNKEDQK